MKVIEGKLIGNGMKIGIVAARFNEFIVSKLVGGAEDGLVRHGVNGDDIELVWVPGSFEIPGIAKKMASSGMYDAVICLGAVIRGSTSHYAYVCAEVSCRDGDRSSDHFWYTDYRQYRAGDRACRHQGRKQGL